MALAHYQGYVENVSTGKALEDAVIRVYSYPGNILQSTFADPSSTPKPVVSSDANGAFNFYIPDGFYDLEYVFNGDVLTRLVNIPIYNPANALPAADLGAFGEVLVASATAADARADLGITNDPAFTSANTLLDSILGNASIVILSDSTGDAATEWPYLLFDGAVAEAYPEWTITIRYWTAGAYAAPTTLQTGTGSKTLNVYAAAVAGTAADYFAGELFTAAVATPAPDLVFVSYGHNGDVQGGGPFSITPTRQLSFFNGLADKLEKNLPTVPVFMIGQNPSISDNGTNPANTNDGFMETRLKVLRPFAALRGWQFINVHGAFLDSATSLDDLLTDAVHPNLVGSQLWADTVWEAMQSVPLERGSDGKILRAWSNRLDFNEWTASNVTLSKETAAGRYQTQGQSTALTVTSTASGGYIVLQALSSEDIPLVQGRYVTFAIWVRNLATNLGNSGRIEIDDGVLPATISSGMVKGDGFTLFTATHLVSSSATSLTLYLYAADAAAASANVIDIDRVSLSLGIEAIDPASSGQIRGRSLRLSGAGSSGIGAFYNVTTSAAGLRFYATDSATLSTGWTADFRQDGFAVKNEADGFSRYEMTQTGGFRMGSGSIAHDMGIDRQTSGVMRFSGAALWPDNTNSRYLGDSTKQWRGIFLRGTGGGDGVFMENVRVLGNQGAAVADAAAPTYVAPTGGATIDAEARAAIVQLAADNASLRASNNALLARCRAHGIIAT